jgi:large-conductance mechanosensitive channel
MVALYQELWKNSKININQNFKNMEIDSNSGLGTMALVVTIINYLILAGVLYFGIKLYMSVMSYLNLKIKYLKKKID